jgi:predicted patatin/cPLA2 family phospholipase
MSRSVSILSIFLLFTSLCVSSLADSPQCLGLVLQGSADKGGYQAGALQGLLSALKPEDIQYDVVSGISVGAVNAAWVSQFAKGEEEQMVSQLVDFWLNLKTSDVYKQWPGGIVQGLLFEPSIYNTAPGQKMLRSYLTKKAQRFVALGATNVDTALYKSFHNFHSDLEADDLVDAVMASYALPGFFPYKVINDTAYIDGGAVMSTDVGAVVSKCRELTGKNDSAIHIDVILLTGTHYKPQDCTNFNGIRMLMRTIELMSYHNAISGLVQAQESYPNVDFRYVIQPQKTLPDSILPISFNHQDIKQMIKQGAQDAIQQVQRGKGVGAKQTFAEAMELFRGGDLENMKGKLMDQFVQEFENLVKENTEKLEI